MLFMGYDFLMAMKMGLAAVDPLFTFWAHSYTHRYYRCGWPRRQCYGCSYTQLQLQLLHLLQKRERMKERERACVNYRLVCLLVGVSVCVQLLLLTSLPKRLIAISFHLCNDIEI